MPDKEFSLISLKDVSEPINKLIESVSSAIGVLYEPTAIRRKAKADADASLIKAKADLEITELVLRVEQRQKNKILRQQKNIENIVNKSTLFLPSECQSNHDVDPDWIFEFFDSCQNCSNENLQTIWAKILAGEIDKPGSFSRRALHTIKIIGVDDANLFTKYCSYSWTLHYGNNHSMRGVFQHYNKNDDDDYAGSRLDHALRCFDITSRDQHILHTLGLISLGTILESGSEDSFVLEYNNLVYAASPKKTGVSLEMTPLSELGLELYPISGAEPNKEYMDIIFEYLEVSGYEVYEAEIAE